jgi:two-component system, LytTR family, sensor kinase
MPLDFRRRVTTVTTIWRNGKAWLVLIALGTAVGVLDASQAYLLWGALGRRVQWNRILLVDVSYWLTFAALVPPVFFLADRFRLERPFSAKRILIHTGAAFGFVLVHIGVAAFIDESRLQITEALLTRFFNMLRNFSVGNFLFYWAIVVIFHAMHYYEQARRKELQAAQLQTSLTESRLQALRSQLNPHFLFNTLNTISVLALKGDHRAVVETLSRLSDLLRATLDDERPQEIPLSEELRFLDGYLEIQRMRFADRLVVHRDISPATLDALVPCMILQPLLENAIRHGVSEQCGIASIGISARRDGGNLRLQVTDKGPGFGCNGSRSKGIGLANTEARLKQLYGSGQEIRYGTSGTTGAIVTILIPLTLRNDRGSDALPTRAATSNRSAAPDRSGSVEVLSRR